MKILNFGRIKRKLYNYEKGVQFKIGQTMGKPRLIADYMGTGARGLALAGTLATAAGQPEIGAPLMTAGAVLGAGSQVMKKGISLKRNLRKY